MDLDPNQALGKAGEFLEKISGGAISELNQLIALPLRERRFKYLLKATLRTKELLEQYGLNHYHLEDGRL
jgi:hypothetical protein